MKRDIYISILVASALSISTLISGCGSSGSGDKIDNKDNSPQENVKKDDPSTTSPHSEEVVRDDDVIEFKTSEDLDYPNAVIVDNYEGLKIAKTKNYVYLTFTHNSVDAQNIQFFIDLDSDSETGYKSESGAEYKIENGQLHVFADQNGTDVWEAYIEKDGEDSVKRNTILNKVDTVRLDNKLFQNDEFSVNAQALDANWVAKISSPRSTSKTFFSSATINDINLTNIVNYSEDLNGSLELKVTDDANSVNFYLLEESVRFHTQFYIDADNNSATGQQFGATWIGFGADYMIEGGKMYKYDNNATDWDWSKYEDVVSRLWKEDKKIISLKVDKKYLNIESNRLKVGVQMLDEDWGNTTFLPKSEETPQEYILNN